MRENSIVGLLFFVITTSSIAEHSGDERDLFPRERQQQAVGEICRDKEYDQTTRDAAFQLLCELSRSDGEYFIATDELTKTLEQEPEFFFTEMSSRKGAFDRWLYSVESTCFVVPYLYTNKTKMEKRRLRLIDEVAEFEPIPASSSINAMRQVVLDKLKQIKVRVVE